MTKTNKIIYWIATVWLSLGMVSSAIVQLLRIDAEVVLFTHLGYPIYFLTFLGICKIVAVIVLLSPKLPVLKEWAYAGVFFTMLGALYSHISVEDGFKDTFPSILLLVLIFASWYLRPESKRVSVRI